MPLGIFDTLRTFEILRMASGVLYRSEVLFYIQNSVSSVPRDIILTTICGFYNEAEIIEAKDALFAVASTLEMDSMPRQKTRRGDSRQKADVVDLLDLWEVLDTGKAILPVFVAANMKRIPPITVSESDVGVLSVHVMEMKAQLKEMAVAQSNLVEMVSKFKTSEVPKMINYHSEFPELTTSNRAATTSVSSQDAPAPVVMGDTAYAAVANRPARPPPPPVRVKGSRNVKSLKALPRRRVLAAYVGRLAKDTTEEDLSKYLAEEGLKGVVCKKLKTKDGRQFKTAAFYVTCCAESRDKFYDENIWPNGVELRDWIYYTK